VCRDNERSAEEKESTYFSAGGCNSPFLNGVKDWFASRPSRSCAS